MNQLFKRSPIGCYGLCSVWIIGQVLYAAAMVPLEKSFTTFLLGQYHVEINTFGSGNIERYPVELKFPYDVTHDLTFPDSGYRVVIILRSHDETEPDNLDYKIRVLSPDGVLYIQTGSIFHVSDTIHPGFSKSSSTIPVFVEHYEQVAITYDERNNNLQFEGSDSNIRFRVIIRSTEEELRHVRGSKKQPRY